MTISRLNHAVLYVRDAEAAARWYGDALGFRVVTSFPGAAFLRASGSDNHHDLGLFSVGADAPGPQRGRVGLYHLAWEVLTIEELAEVGRRLSELGALVGASDHGASKSLYAQDLDGNEFEVMWAVPREAWTPEIEHGAPVRPLDLDAELERWGCEPAKEERPPAGLTREAEERGRARREAGGQATTELRRGTRTTQKAGSVHQG